MMNVQIASKQEDVDISHIFLCLMEAKEYMMRKKLNKKYKKCINIIKKT